MPVGYTEPGEATENGHFHSCENGRFHHVFHVKGHSTDGGNDRADELAWWGKEAGPF
eukprot:SAG31_NODE_34520_length_332_cov_0.673820_1_plen_56_part_01